MFKFFNEYSFLKQSFDFLLTLNSELNNDTFNLSSLIHDYYKNPNDKTLFSIKKLINKIEDGQKVFLHNKEAFLYNYEKPVSKLANKVFYNRAQILISENNIIKSNYEKLKFNNEKLFR